MEFQILNKLLEIGITLIRRKRKLYRKFENAIDLTYIRWRGIRNEDPAKKYTIFIEDWILMKGPDRYKWLTENKISEVSEFYEWLDKKDPGWGNAFKL